MNNSSNAVKLRSIDQWGDIEWTSMDGAFGYATGLNIKATDTPDLSKVTSMYHMFYYTTNLTGNFSGWDTSKVENMSYMFYNATNFDQDLSSRDTSKVTNMYYMFYNASGFNQDLSSRNVEGISSSSNMQRMFQNAGLSTYNYNAILDSRSKQNVRSDITNFVVSSSYGGACR
jgi:surface protein